MPSKQVQAGVTPLGMERGELPAGALVDDHHSAFRGPDNPGTAACIDISYVKRVAKAYAQVTDGVKSFLSQSSV